jgi:Flp pilus assembly protein TadD
VGRGDLLRASLYALLALLFVGAVVLAVVLYGRSRRPGLDELVRAQGLLAEAARLLDAGDLPAAETLHRRLAGERAMGRLLAFFEGSLEAAYQRAGRQRLEAHEKTSDPVDALVREAGRLDAAGDRFGAERKVAEAIARAPEDLSLRLIRARLVGVLGRYEDVLAEADEIERRTGPGATVHGLRAGAYLGLKQFSRAQEEFSRALVYEPASVTLRLGLVDALTRMGQLPRAAAEAIQILRYDDANPDAYLALGLIEEMGGNPTAAETAYRQALRFDPDHPKALNNLAFLLADRLNRPQEALPLAQKAVELAPGTAAFQDTLGWVYHRLGRDQEARAAISKARQLDPTYADAAQHWRELNAAPTPRRTQ